jgi:hypothetical protein
MLNGRSKIMWPAGKKFAFTIVDDTDWATVENVGPVYDFLLKNGFLITKTVWPLAPPEGAKLRGLSLEDDDYRKWILDLKDRGVEIALHGISDRSSTRAKIVEGLERFREIIGHAPRMHINHSEQEDCIYWGAERFDGATKHIYRFIQERLLKYKQKYHGHVEDSPYFWGDLCQETVTFVRNLVFFEINTLKMDPLMPYHDSRRPYVPFWFSSSAGPHVEEFCKLLSEDNQDRLVEEGGACIVYTHFAFNFLKDGQLNPRFVELMRRLAKLPGWFAPASTLLNYIGEQRGWQVVKDDRKALRRMGRKWLIERIKRNRIESKFHYP